MVGYKKNFYRTKRQKYSKKGIPKAVIPKPVTDKHIAKVAKRAIRIRQEEKCLYGGKNTICVQDNRSFISPIVGTAAQSIFRLNEVSQGDLSYSRDGAQLEAVSLEWNLYNYLIEQAPASTVPAFESRFRVIIMWWKQDTSITPTTSASYPQYSEVFETQSGIYPFKMVDSLYNHLNKHKYQILFDKKYSLNTGGNMMSTITRKINLKNTKVAYDTSDVTANTGISKSLLMIIMSDNAASAAPGANHTINHDYNGKFVFRDI